MVWARGHRTDYEDWGRIAGENWGWEAVRTAYRALEDNEAGGNAYRGTGGPLFISANKTDLHPLVETYLASAEAAGHRRNPDFNGEDQEGVGIYQMTIKNARRNSSARAFLRRAMKRPNVNVITRAHATRVLIEGKKAVGVVYRKGGRDHEVRAARDVILAGGAVNSPQLLMLSGIGPKAELAPLGIEVVTDNPNVGQHMNDHVGINYTWEVSVPTYNNILRPWWGKLWVGMRYFLGGRGPLAKSINHGGGFFRTSGDQPRPNMQLYMQAFSTLIPKEGERPLLTPDPFPGFSLGVSNCRPTSRGEIMIRSSDPFEHPRIMPNAYSTNHDVDEMLDAVKFLRGIAAQPVLANFIDEELRPGPECRTDEELIADFRQRSGTCYHASGTCRMSDNASQAVIDSRLRVHGVAGLRVCDASVFPNIISGNTNGPSMMVGWKGAELILADAAR